MSETPERVQARMIAALPEFPRYGYYVKVALAGYGPDLDAEDMPATSWEDVASQIVSELNHMAEFNGEGSDIGFTAAETHYAGYQRGDDGIVQAVDAYHEALADLTRSRELSDMAANFDNERANAPLYAGRPDLWHATIYNLITEHFPLDVSRNSRLYVWECTEDPGTEES